MCIFLQTQTHTHTHTHARTHKHCPQCAFPECWSGSQKTNTLWGTGRQTEREKERERHTHKNIFISSQNHLSAMSEVDRVCVWKSEVGSALVLGIAHGGGGKDVPDKWLDTQIVLPCCVHTRDVYTPSMYVQVIRCTLCTSNSLHTLVYVIRYMRKWFLTYIMYRYLVTYIRICAQVICFMHK